MGAKTLISEEDYLQMTFDGPEPDYVNGEIVDRGMPNLSHSQTSRRVITGIAKHESEGLFVCPELRVRLAAGKIRVIDIAVYAGAEPLESVPTEPPLAVIEIVSPDDRHERLLEKLADYQNWGVTHIFLADPAFRRLSRYWDGSLNAVSGLALPEHGVSIPATGLFP